MALPTAGNIGAALLAALLSSCIAPPPEVSPRMLTFVSGTANLTTLEAGRQIFTTRCAKCHALDSPAAFVPEEWRRIVADMAEPAKITKQQENILLSYLLAARNQIAADAPKK